MDWTQIRKEPINLKVNFNEFGLALDYLTTGRECHGCLMTPPEMTDASSNQPRKKKGQQFKMWPSKLEIPKFYERLS